MFTSPYQADIPSISIPDWVFGSPDEPLSTDPIFIDVHNPSRWLSLSTFRSWTKRFAAGLQKAGVTQDDCVLCFSENMLLYPVAVVGTIASGAHFAEPGLPDDVEDAVAAISSCNPSIILVEKDFWEVAKQAVEKSKQNSKLKAIYIIDDEIIDGSANGSGVYENWGVLMASQSESETFTWKSSIKSLDQAAFLYFSSGSTGFSKVSVHTHVTLVASLTSLADLAKRDPRLEESQSTIRSLPLHVTNQNRTEPRRQTVFVWPALGIQTFVMKTYDVSLALECIENFQITDLLTTVPVLRDIRKALAAANRKNTHDSLKVISTGEASHTKKFVDDIESCWAPGQVIVQNRHGMTEAGGIMGWIPIIERAIPSSVGKLLANFEAKLINLNTGEDCAKGQPGKLLIGGPALSKGYLNNQAAFAKAMVEEGWFNTGDVASIDEDENWFIFGRERDVIRIADRLASPLELEQLLLEQPGIVDAAVIGVNTTGGYHIRGLVVQGEGAEIERAENSFIARCGIGRSMVKLTSIPEIPRSAGKVRRELLRQKVKEEMVAKFNGKQVSNCHENIM